MIKITLLFSLISSFTQILAAQELPSVVQKYQWALKNQGGYQMVDLDVLKKFVVPGVKGVDIEMPATLKKTKPVLVAVLDTGIDKSHPWLKNRIYKKTQSCAAFEKYVSCLQEVENTEGLTINERRDKVRVCKNNHFVPGSDPEGDGYSLDCSGWSLVNKDDDTQGVLGKPDFSDESGHGTHVAGIIAQVSPNAVIIPVQALPEEPNAPIKPQSVSFPFPSQEKDLARPVRLLGDSIARAVIYAVKSGAEVINFSAGWNPGADSKFLREVIAEAQKQGVIFVAAAGNDSTQALLRPCTYPGVICVGSHNPDGSISYFSNYGPHVDILAPGLNIFSAYPTDMMAALFREEIGYNYYSGTSQATPFVTGVVAEMIANGIPKSEIYPRLLLSAKNSLPFTGLFEGLPHETIRPVATQFQDTKNVRSGRLQFRSALEMKSQPLLIIEKKEAQAINWNRKDQQLKLNFKIKNLWQDVALSDLKWNLSMQDPLYKDLATVDEPRCQFSALAIWKMGQEFDCESTLTILGDVSRTQLASKIDVELDVFIKGQKQKISSVASYEIFVLVSRQMDDPEAIIIPFAAEARGGQLIPIDDNFSKATGHARREYFNLKKNKENWQLGLVSFINGQYNLVGSHELPLRPRDLSVDDDDPTTKQKDVYRDHFFVKGDLNSDGKDEYLFGVIKFEFDKNSPAVSFFIFDSDFKSFKEINYDGSTSVFPFDFSWLNVKTTTGSVLRPSWIAPGFEAKKLNSREIWKNKVSKDDPFGGQAPEIRFYYFDENFKVKSVQDINGYRIVDLLYQTNEDKRKGNVPVLLAKNKGTKLHPSYFYDFAIGVLNNGQLASFQELDWSSYNSKYTNLLDTRVDKILNLNVEENEFIGTFWFGTSFNGYQKVTQLVRDEKGHYAIQELPLQRSAFPFDFPSFVRSSYHGAKESSAYISTNTEIQYAVKDSTKEILTSRERYTFSSDRLSSNLLFPLTVQKLSDPMQKFPALYEAQNEGFSAGVKILVPVFAYDNKPETIKGIVAPARLRFTADTKFGCSPIETPYFDKIHYIEFFCRDRIIRLKVAL